jgi:threonine aldolase
MRIVDLRSDTLTKPTAAMRQAMAAAEVGDDVYQEDPTVNALEEMAARMVGKEAALFVPTGTMGNTIGIKVHTEHGQEVICDARSHILNYELSMMAWFCGCLARAIPTADGLLDWDRVRAEVRPLGPHAAPTGLIAVENTHNVGGGTVYEQGTLDAICSGAHELGLAVHMDGARLFNAAVASGVPAREIVRNVDTVMFCLSKGLGAPVGSMLAGPRALVDRGRLYRKRLGGGMRQAGILAAAGVVALEAMVDRLAEDHANAAWIAERLSGMRGIGIDPSRVRTNIVIFDVAGTGWTPAEFCARLRERGIRTSPFGATVVRIVTHYDAPREACEHAVARIEEMLQNL